MLIMFSQVLSSKKATFTVTGLTPSEKYVVAVAAYNRKGQLIGGSIGHTSFPVVAASPLPVALAYGFLAKVV